MKQALLFVILLHAACTTQPTVQVCHPAVQVCQKCPAGYVYDKTGFCEWVGDQFYSP